MTERPNLILVVFDTARRDAFEPFGAPVGTTPAFRQLAERGEAHSSVYAPACWTVPSHAAMFTGLLHRSAGLEHIAGGSGADFREGLQRLDGRTLAAVLQRFGYRTTAISANGWVHHRHGFGVGFDEFVAVRTHRHDGLNSDTWKGKLRWYAEALQAHLDDGAELVEREIERSLAQRDSRPLFLFVNLVECHTPYLPPKPFTPLGPIRRLGAAHDARVHQTLEGTWRASVGGWTVSDRGLARMRAQYAASIRQLDAWLARLHETLDRLRLLDETQLVVTSDHGENLGEGQLLGHSFSLDDRLLRVPFAQAGPAPLRLPELASLTDIPAAIAGALQVEHHPWEGEDRSDGAVVAQFDAPGTRDNPDVHDAIQRWGLGEDAIRRMCTSFTAATDGRWKLVRRLGGEELFDLEHDPLEVAPVPVHRLDDDGPLAHLRRALDRAAAAERPGHRAPVDTAVTDEDRHLEEQLRFLGYL